MNKTLQVIVALCLFCLHFTIQAKNIQATPTITAGTATGNIRSCQGNASVDPSIEQFTLSGSNLTGDITAAPPPNFEVSLAPGSGYASSITIPQVAGVVNPTVIYVRSSASAAAGNLVANIVLTSPGAITQNVEVTGIVSVVPVINYVPNQNVDNGYPTQPVNFSGKEANAFTWVNDTPGIGLPASGSGNIAAFKAVNTGTTPITATITVTSSYAGFAYIANTNSNTVSVINTITQAVIATIPSVGIGPRGVAVSPDGSLVYVASSSSNTISIINTLTNKVIATTSVGVSNPSGIAVSPSGGTLYVTNYLYNTVSVLNAVNYAIIATIPVDKNPFALAVSPDGQTLYVANTGTNTVSVINTSSNTDVATIAVGFSPQGVAISSDGSKVYISNFNNQSVSVINTATNLVTAIIPVGTDPFGVSVTSAGDFVYVTDYNSKQVSIINAVTNTVSNSVGVELNPYSLGNFITGTTVCTPAPLKFTITVEPTPQIVIPNTFTPNGDGINDLWDIKYIESYPKCTVQVFNRYGTKLFFSNGYPVAWDGKYKGANVPDGTYYYIINLDKNFKPIGGHITIIR